MRPVEPEGSALVTRKGDKVQGLCVEEAGKQGEEARNAVTPIAEHDRRSTHLAPKKGNPGLAGISFSALSISKAVLNGPSA